MIYDQRLVRMVLQAAVRHAKAHSGDDKRSITIWFVNCVYVDMKRRKWYESGYTVGRVLVVLKRSATVAQAAAEFGLTPNDFKVARSPETPPPSNTGATLEQSKLETVLEDYFNAETS